MPSQPNDTASTHCEPDSVGAYAALLDKSVASVLALLQEAGVEKIHASDRLSEQEQSRLLNHLKASLGICDQPNRMLPSGANKQQALGYLAYAQYQIIRRNGQLVSFESEDEYRKVRQRTTEMLKQLRELTKKVLRSVSVPTVREGPISRRRERGGGTVRHGSVFFHSLKVNGRNLP